MSLLAMVSAVLYSIGMVVRLAGSLAELVFLMASFVFMVPWWKVNGFHERTPDGRKRDILSWMKVNWFDIAHDNQVWNILNEHFFKLVKYE